MTAEKEFFERQDRSRVFYNLSNDNENRLLKILPDKKYFEFVHHQWNKGIVDDLDKVWNNWAPWEIWSYPIDDLIRYKNMILDNIELIKGARVADIGSHLGIGVLFCLNLGAKHCVGIEPVGDKNNLSSFICEQAGHVNFNFLTGEIKQPTIYNGIQNFDTLILGSLIDMIPDHYRLMENIAKTKIKNIIVEVAEDERYARSEVPFINWESYVHKPQLEGPYNPQVNQPLHGEPNLAFLKMLMAEFSYVFKHQTFFHMQSHSQKPKMRSVSVFELNEKGN